MVKSTAPGKAISNAFIITFYCDAFCLFKLFVGLKTLSKICTSLVCIIYKKCLNGKPHTYMLISSALVSIYGIQLTITSSAWSEHKANTHRYGSVCSDQLS